MADIKFSMVAVPNGYSIAGGIVHQRVSLCIERAGFDLNQNDLLNLPNYIDFFLKTKPAATVGGYTFKPLGPPSPVFDFPSAQLFITDALKGKTISDKASTTAAYTNTTVPPTVFKPVMDLASFAPQVNTVLNAAGPTLNGLAKMINEKLEELPVKNISYAYDKRLREIEAAGNTLATKANNQSEKNSFSYIDQVLETSEDSSEYYNDLFNTINSTSIYRLFYGLQIDGILYESSGKPLTAFPAGPQRLVITPGDPASASHFDFTTATEIIQSLIDHNLFLINDGTGNVDGLLNIGEGKIKALTYTPEAIMQNLKDYLERSQNSAANFRESTAVGDVATCGINVYMMRDLITTTPAPAGNWREEHLTRSFAIYVQPENTKTFKSLTAIQESAYFIKGQLPESTELGIAFDSVVHSYDPDANQETGINNGFLFSWDGTTISFRNPLRNFEIASVPAENNIIQPEPPNEAQKLAWRTDQRFEALRNGFKRDFPHKLALYKNTRATLGIDWFPFNTYTAERPAPKYLIKRQYTANAVADTWNGLLRYGKSYSFLVARQYINGYVPARAYIEGLNKISLPQNQDDPLKKFYDGAQKKVSNQVLFQRHEKIKDIRSLFEQDIFEAGKIKPDHFGESEYGLVIKEGDHNDMDDCTRYLLPPMVNGLLNYAWHDFAAFPKKWLPEKDLRYWYTKFQCEIPDETTFNQIKSDHEKSDKPGLKTCNNGCKKFCGRLLQHSVWNGTVNYLPDPLIAGFRITFYDHKGMNRSTINEYNADLSILNDPNFIFKSDDYPNVKPWKIVLKKRGRREDVLHKDNDDQELTIYLRQGQRLYARLSPTYLKKTEVQFSSAIIDQFQFLNNHRAAITTEGDYESWKLFANEPILSFTHASQRPVVDPVIKGVTIIRGIEIDDSTATNAVKPVSPSFSRIRIELFYENLTPDPDDFPTGSVDVYALWDDFGEEKYDPVSKLSGKRKHDTADKGYIKIASFNFEQHQTETLQALYKQPKGSNGSFEFTTESSFVMTHHSNISFLVRNTSKYAQFFPGARKDSDDCSVYSDYFPGKKDAAVRILNSKKPVSPIVSKILPLITRDYIDNQTIKVSGNRLMFYFDRAGAMASGEGERIGIIVPSAKPGPHHDYFTKNDFFFSIGKDSITDGMTPVTVSFSVNDFLFLPAHGVEEQYTALYAPHYDEAMELLTFRPAYDREQHLWYVELIVNLEKYPYHNPFLGLSFVRYQEHSATRHSQSADGKPLPAAANPHERFENDLGLSLPLKADFVTVYPERTFRQPKYSLFRKTRKQFSITGYASTLYYREKELHSVFLAVVEGEDSHGGWRNLSSTIGNSQQLLHYLTVHFDKDKFSIDLEISAVDDTGVGDCRLILHELEQFEEPAKGVVFSSVHEMTGVRPINHFIFKL